MKDVSTHCEACPTGYDGCNTYDVTCTDEYYNNEGVCEPCNTGCLKCDTTPDNCLSCIDGYYQ